MHPAPSVIVFTVLSGLGFGILAFLALGLPPLSGAAAFLAWGLGYALAVTGLLASTFHLGNPQRALLAFTQWRTSWLSREAWASVASLLMLAPVALADIVGWPLRWIFAVPGALLSVLTIFCTAMIYAQIRAVPRWHHWTTPALFMGFAVAGGAIATGQPAAAFLTLALAALLALAFRLGDGQFARAGQTPGTATGLSGQVTAFEWPHTGDTWLLREMIHVVGRRHAARLRVIAILSAGLLPAAILLLLPGLTATALAAAVHLTGAFAARWLFFAEAEHVVGLYYGRR
jgi:DMSO reductase anchor subunit